MLEPADMRTACDVVSQELPSIRDAVSKVHQDGFMQTLLNAITQIDYHVKYRGATSSIDVANLRRLRTSCAYLYNVINVNFASKEQFVRDTRPDMLPLINDLINELVNHFTVPKHSSIDITMTELAFVGAAAESVIKAFYNPPQPSVLMRVLHNLTSSKAR